MARSSTIVYLRPGDGFPVREFYPADQRHQASRARVSVDLVDADQGAVWVDVTDPTSLDGLITALAEAQDWLAAEATGQARLPVDPEPVGDTGLTLHPLPMGVS